MSQNSETSILERIIEPEADGLSLDLARHILSLTFKPVDQERMAVLSVKAQGGTLTADEERELDDYIRLGDFLALLKSKARLSLQKPHAVA